MYPAIRFLWQMWKHRNDDPLPLFGTHVSRHMCLPWDLDFWKELNNGRTLTLYDLGRIPMSRRIGLIPVLRENGWGMTVAGSCPRYRRRVTAFQTVEMRSRAIGWDSRFLYTEQSMWRADGECTSHVLFRIALTGKRGIVPPCEMAARLGHTGPSPDLPHWVTDWIAAEAARPWPPMQEA